ncbi:MAG: sensor histidine kinase, partial [Alphaproteobacteria bacterium]
MTMISTPEIGDARANQPWPVVAVAVVSVLAFVLDLSLPASSADRLAYLGIVLLGWWLAQPRDVIALAVFATILVVAGHAASLAPVDPSTLVESGLALLAIWATAGVVAAAKRRCGELRQESDALRAQAREQKARLSAAKTHAELTSRTASDLLSGMSHELRTPLNAIIGFSEIVRTEMFGPIGSDRYRDYLEDIHESGRHLLSLINDLLDVARIDAGKIMMTDQNINITALVHGCMSKVSDQADSRQITLTADVADGLPPLRADQGMLEQVMLNLLSNAIKFTAAGGQIRITAWCRPNTGCVLQVSDTGK